MEQIKRTFIAGDEWLFFKLYTGYKTAEMVLRETLLPLSEHLLREQIIDQWFYIRYNDPQYHLRIRLHLPRPEQTGFVMMLFNQALAPYIEEETIWKVQLDTYQREIERYGIETMEISEKLFFIDSRATAHLINSFKDGESQNLRWLLSMKLIDALLSDFQLNLEGKKALLDNMANGFAQEFGFSENVHARKQLSDKYRADKTLIEQMMNNPVPENFQYIFTEKSLAIQPVARLIIDHCASGSEPGLNSLLSSFIHMMMNRLFRTSQRKYELLIYDFLNKYYLSIIQRGKQKKGGTIEN